MPYLDETGPWGLGPMTGKGYGRCGRGYGRCGRGYGGGYRHRHRYRHGWGPGPKGYGYRGYERELGFYNPPPYIPEDEKTYLNEKRHYLQEELRYIEERLKDLDTESEKEN